MHFKFVENARGGGHADIIVYVGADLDALERAGVIVLRTSAWTVLQAALVTLDRITRPAIQFHLPCDEEV